MARTMGNEQKGKRAMNNERNESRINKSTNQQYTLTMGKIAMGKWQEEKGQNYGRQMIQNR
jgi:hypothetical protein